MPTSGDLVSTSGRAPQRVAQRVDDGVLDLQRREPRVRERRRVAHAGVDRERALVGQPVAPGDGARARVERRARRAPRTSASCSSTRTATRACRQTRIPIVSGPSNQTPPRSPLAPAMRIAAISRRSAPSVPRAQVTKKRNIARSSARRYSTCHGVDQALAPRSRRRRPGPAAPSRRRGPDRGQRRRCASRRAQPGAASSRDAPAARHAATDARVPERHRARRSRATLVAGGASALQPSAMRLARPRSVDARRWRDRRAPSPGRRRLQVRRRGQRRARSPRSRRARRGVAGQACSQTVEAATPRRDRWPDAPQAIRRSAPEATRPRVRSSRTIARGQLRRATSSAAPTPDVATAHRVAVRSSTVPSDASIRDIAARVARCMVAARLGATRVPSRHRRGRPAARFTPPGFADTDRA